ncbi:MAG: O-antigen ligase family protein [Acidobacteria bacterium]|nr:O-antigen ligase family protein [Acidobacteriota bacterium]
MERFVNWIDETAGLNANAPASTLWLERIVFIFLILTTLSAPHSIAATQIAWLSGMMLWVVRIFVRPRPTFRPGKLDYAIWAFFGWSVVSSVFSYAPDISINKLRVVSLFLMFYFVYHNVRSARSVRFLAGALIFSAMVAVVWTPVERAIGRGVQIYGFQGGPFEQAALAEGDTILEINGRKVSSLDDISRFIAEDPNAEKFRAKVYHSDSYLTIEVPTGRIKPALSPDESLSVKRWQKGRTWRSAGFYGHYTTFAEVLQLIMSLAFGIFASLVSQRFAARTDVESGAGLFSIKTLGFCLAAMTLAMILTATRASQLAVMVSAAAIVLMLGNKKLIIALLAVGLPLALAGLIVLQQTRGVGFLDSTDNSTTWRQTVYREGLELWTASPRNFVVGVGMDSVQRYAKDWHLFDDGRLPTGHFHSTPLQLAVERGLPALLLWLAIIGLYFRSLWRFKSDSAVFKGIVLGTFGGAIGFFLSGLVHYNLGDSEVAMVFFFLMGLSLALIDQNDRG